MNTTQEALAELTARAQHLRPEGDIAFADLIEDPVDTEQLAELWLLYEDWKTTVNQVERILNTELAGRMDEEDSMFTFGDWQVFRGWRSVSEKCVDTEMFYDWLDDNPDQVRKLVNPNSIRKGSLPADVRDRLFEKTRPPKAEKQAVAAPVQVLEDNRQRRRLEAANA